MESVWRHLLIPFVYAFCIPLVLFPHLVLVSASSHSLAHQCEDLSLFENPQAAIEKKEQWGFDLYKNMERLVTDKGMSRHNHDRFDMVGPIGPSCKNTEVYGVDDGEKRACGLLNRVGQNCTIISIGSNNDWAFEESIFAKTTCKVHTFDCTVEKSAKPPSAIQSRVKLHHVCIGNANKEIDSRIFVNWEGLMKLSEIESAPTFLKMDIEGYEWDVLPNIIGHVHRPLQIAFELHYQTQMTELPWKDREKSATEILAFIDNLYRKGHYFVIDRKDNVRCPHCTELLLGKLCKRH